MIEVGYCSVENYPRGYGGSRAVITKPIEVNLYFSFSLSSLASHWIFYDMPKEFYGFCPIIDEDWNFRFKDSPPEFWDLLEGILYVGG